MAAVFLDPGLLSKRARLEIGDLVSDEAGGAAAVWRELRELSVHVEPVSIEARQRFDREEATVTHRVVCRAVPEVARGLSFVLGERRLTIVSVHDPDESGRYLLCRCEEEA